jgi:hypothetical protein
MSNTLDDSIKCEICGGELEISVTLIECKKCKTLWGRCNGVWVEVKSEEEDEVDN